MNLFKSQAQRQLERDMEIRRGIQTIRRNLRTLEKSVADYRAKAVRAKQIESNEQLRVLKDAIRRSLAQMRMQERQLLAVETALQMKTQAEATQQFVVSMQAVSKSIAASFGGADLGRTLGDYEKALAQARDMEERMNLFLDTSADLMSVEGSSDGLVSDEEVDRMIDDDLAASESDHLDARINAELARVGQRM